LCAFDVLLHHLHIIFVLQACLGCIIYFIYIYIHVFIVNVLCYTEFLKYF
jgi:hypothetical protein